MMNKLRIFLIVFISLYLLHEGEAKRGRRGRGRGHGKKGKDNKFCPCGEDEKSQKIYDSDTDPKTFVEQCIPDIDRVCYDTCENDESCETLKSICIPASTENKPGSCPTIDIPMKDDEGRKRGRGRGRDRDDDDDGGKDCEDDSQCRGSKKCCKFEEKMKCTKPVQEEPKCGTCDKNTINVCEDAEATNKCTSDAECPGRYKCCGCQCQKPSPGDEETEVDP